MIQNEAVHTEILNYRKDSIPFWVDLNIIPLKNTANEITHYAAIVKDLTTYKRLKQELHRLNHMDVLTGVANREHFMLLADSEFGRTKRHQRPISLVLFGLNNFKRLNNIYGHQFDDNVLKTVADNCRTLLRQSDIFGLNRRRKVHDYSTRDVH